MNKVAGSSKEGCVCVEMLTESFSEMFEKIEPGKRLILGIDGLSRSGKTTLADNLKVLMIEREIPFCIFHIDDHIVERKKRYGTGHEEWFEYYSLQWDVEWLGENLFEKLRNSEQVCLPFYDWKMDIHTFKNITLSEACVVIVEGVFLQRKEWRNSFDYMIYLDCPRSKRFLREHEHTQLNIKKFQERYWKAEDYYIQTEAPLKHADLVMNG